VGTLGLALNASEPVKNAAALMDDVADTSAGVVSHIDEAVDARQGFVSGAGDAGGDISPFYPPNRGFDGESARATLVPGTKIDRYGGPSGTFASPAGTAPGSRSLPPGRAEQPLRTYEVVSPIEVDAGRAAPWFGQSGGGEQYDLGSRIEDLVRGALSRRLSERVGS